MQSNRRRRPLSDTAEHVKTDTRAEDEDESGQRESHNTKLFETALSRFDISCQHEQVSKCKKRCQTSAAV